MIRGVFVCWLLKVYNHDEFACVFRFCRVGLLKIACLILLSGEWVDPGIFPLPFRNAGSDRSTHRSCNYSRASSLQCSNDLFTAEGFGEVVVSQSVHVTQGMSLNIAEASSGASKCRWKTRYSNAFLVYGASSLHLVDMVLANGDGIVGGTIHATGQATVFSGGKRRSRGKGSFVWW